MGKDRTAQRIPAQMVMLAAGSAVFDAMFNGGMATTSTVIELPDVEPAAFLALLSLTLGLGTGPTFAMLHPPEVYVYHSERFTVGKDSSRWPVAQPVAQPVHRCGDFTTYSL
ncbi:hypothetical protein NDU88_001715 [Pleurodeles waltl]|uniref:BTB domain-containing protein n=1 Tax=Pleurodeles waltl TaxID=8319 RepID=A0AAV7R8S8_PLEWA|nr:hypothetical protein NDU88_001715 [Pleurodeles waltl]